LSLIHEAENNPKVRKVLPGLIAIIRDLGAQPVIEGIETQVQLNIAIESGSTLLQGNFLGKPVTAKELKPARIFASSIPAAA
jgi:EAL domain-containing protein (putative c-di-GMP-specific phosphodiesterase class I)